MNKLADLNSFDKVIYNEKEYNVIANIIIANEVMSRIVAISESVYFDKDNTPRPTDTEKYQTIGLWVNIPNYEPIKKEQEPKELTLFDFLN